MRVAVTGGAGFIGSHVCEALLANGHDVLVVDDLSTGREDRVPPGARFARVDIRERDPLRDALTRFAPRVVCHHAAQTSVAVSTRDPLRDAAVNVLGTINVLDAGVACGVERVVLASTGGALYGEVAEPQRAGVDWPCAPVSPYGASKLAAERYMALYGRAHGLAFNILRYANVYGPGQDPHGEAGVVAIFCSRLLAGEPLILNAREHEGDDGCVRDYVHVSDVVRVNMLAIQGALSGSVSHVCTGVGTNTATLARLLASHLGCPLTLRGAPPRRGDLQRSVLLPSPELPAPLPLGEGLASTARWFSETRARAGAGPT